MNGRTDAVDAVDEAVAAWALLEAWVVAPLLLGVKLPLSAPSMTSSKHFRIALHRHLHFRVFM